MSEQPSNHTDEVMQRATEVALSHIDPSGGIDALSLAEAKRAELEERSHEAAQTVQETTEEHLEQERPAETTTLTEEEKVAKNARMEEMDRWANTTGAIAEEKAKASTENERKFKEDINSSGSIDDVDYHTEQYGKRNKEISEGGVLPDHIPGTTKGQWRHGGGGIHNVVDTAGTTISTINGIDEFNRSPKNISNDNLPHGRHNNPDLPTFR